ncbi:MAG: sigma 54-interacting transcriptional regulator [Dethiobacteria bacterium]
MRRAADFVTTKPVILGREANVEKVLDILLKAEDGLICLGKNGIINQVITCESALSSIKNASGSRKLTAADLALKKLETTGTDTFWPNFIDKLNNNGIVAVFDSNKTIIGVITLNSILKELAGKALELEREIDAIINFTSDEIFVADGDGRVLRANSVFEDNFGVKLDSVIGKNVNELEKKKIFTPSVTRLVIDKKSAQTVIQSRRDGRKLLATGTPAFNEDGSVFRVIVNTRDITKLNNLKQQLEEAELLKNRYQQELVELRQGYLHSGEIVASSPVMLDLLKVATKIAAVDSTVLLTGESGVGKGMIARYIHNTSPRADKPFTVVNCGAIPENLLESELFGYAGGAFTGARREGKIGKLELANEGTLFLDEITELPLNLQVKLLHVIQEGIISRIGGTREIKLNLRFIAATNRDIAGLVEEGKFREDLYFRLDVIPLIVPPLRERHEDIKALAGQFLSRLNRRYQKDKYFNSEVYSFLEEYHWPGNVRELENLVERMMIVVDSSEIGAIHLPRRLTGIEQAEIPKKPAIKLEPLKEAKESLECRLLIEALRVCRTTYEIAEILKIDQSTVVRKLKKYNLVTGGHEID